MKYLEKYNEYLTYATSLFDDFMEISSELIQYPTIAFREPEAVNNCAKSLEKIFKKYGYKSEIYPTAPKGSPVVYAEKNVNAKKTILFYHHYDVQPEDPIELWESSPWELTQRGDRIFARGIADDKGELVISLLAIKLLEEKYGKTPVNVKFVCEGEEEAGSQNLHLFINKHHELLKADGCIWEGATLTPSKEESNKFESPMDLVCGLKGNAYFNLKTVGPPKFPRTDVHSGEAAATPNAAWKLVWALTTLKDKNEKILIDGFNELVIEPNKDELEVLKRSDTHWEEEFKQDYQLEKILLNRTGLDLITELSLKPSLTICGLSGGFQGEGSKTIVPAEALAKLDFRLVPNLTMKKVEQLLKKHLIKHGFDDLEAELIGGYDPAKTPVTHPFIKLLEKISNDITTPKITEITPFAFGSGPAYLFTPHTPLCFVGNFIGGVNGHASNENIPIRTINSSIAFNAVIAEEMTNL